MEHSTPLYRYPGDAEFTNASVSCKLQEHRRTNPGFWNGRCNQCKPDAHSASCSSSLHLRSQLKAALIPPHVVAQFVSTYTEMVRQLPLLHTYCALQRGNHLLRPSSGRDFIKLRKVKHTGFVFVCICGFVVFLARLIRPRIRPTTVEYLKRQQYHNQQLKVLLNYRNATKEIAEKYKHRGPG